MWTLLTLLSDEGLPYKEECHPSLKVNVKCPSGKIIPCSLEYSSKTKVRSRALYEQVAKQTGVAIELQILSYKMNQIQPDIPLQRYRLEDGCCIDLIIKGVGGGNGSDTGIVKLFLCMDVF
jgi:hypothetical protein